MAPYSNGNHARLAGLILATAFALTFLSLAFGQTPSIPTPKKTTDPCKLQYSHFHLLFTMPPLILLYILAQPFLTALDWYKLYLLPIIAFVWTAPWDNILVYREAWWYPTSCVMAKIGYVPVEEYAFFIFQSLMTALFTIVLTRWSMPRSGSCSTALAVLLPIWPASVVALGLYTLLSHPDGQTSRYYLSMIAWWASVPLTLLWWGTASSWLSVGSKKVATWGFCIGVPTLYLCSADIFALRRGTWHISEKRSLQKFVVPDLPLEEAIFFLATNTILVSACFAFDRVIWQRREEEDLEADCFAPLSPNYFAIDWNIARKVWVTFTRLDKGSPVLNFLKRREEVRQSSLDILARASKSFNMAASLLPWDLRIDLGCLYAFARAMDDFVDQPLTLPGPDRPEAASHSRRIFLLRRLVDIAFSTSQSIEKQAEQVARTISDFRSLGATFPEHTEHDLCQSALAAGFLRCIVPDKLWQELIDGYTIDSVTGGPHFRSFEEQADYAQKVAGSIGEMCVRVVLARSGILVSREYVVQRDISREALITSRLQSASQLDSSQVQRAEYAPHIDIREIEKLLRDARRMGVSLQLINIARDIVKDATDLARCYLVTGRDDAAGYRRALRCANFVGTSCTKRTTSSEEEGEVVNMVAPLLAMSTEQIFLEKTYLLDVADSIYRSCVGTIELLPCRSARTGFRAACAVYANIGTVIRRRGAEDCWEKSRATTAERVWTAVKAVYLSGS